MRSSTPAALESYHDTIDPDTALSVLSNACRRLADLAGFDAGGGTRRYHRSVSIIHEICEALVSGCGAATIVRRPAHWRT